jgi:3-phosphoshikimate 1-carboxyvinyltransferase
MSKGTHISPHYASIQGTLVVPGDKSISHRSVILGSLAKGVTSIKGFLKSEDSLNTLKCFEQMGINYTWKDAHTLQIEGKGLQGLTAPKETLYVGNSGTAIRLLSGVLTGQVFSSEITGDESIMKRPMKRVIEPLRQMGARIHSQDNLAPLCFEPSNLQGITYESPIASAQVKSCLLLAGLYAKGRTILGEPNLSRNHSEIMLRHFGIILERNDTISHGISLEGGQTLHSADLIIPADVSSAAFFMVAALITPGAKILLKNVGINSTRRGIIDVLIQMGAQIDLDNIVTDGEPMADIKVSYSQLSGISLSGNIIPNIIDEIPILCIAAAYAQGETDIREAGELRFKESDRIQSTAKMLQAMGASVEEYADGLSIQGQTQLKGGSIESCGDHRIAMSAAIGALASETGVTIDDMSCIQTSFPEFLSLLTSFSNGRGSGEK